VLKTTNTAHVPSGSGVLYFSADVGDAAKVEWCFISQFRATEPAWGSWGTEETFAYNISNSPSSKAFGIVAANSTNYAKGSAPSNPVQDAECTFTITNNDSVNPVKLVIKSTNFTGGVGWTLTSGAPGSNTVRLTAYASGTNPASGVVLTTSDQTLIASLAASATKKWDFKFETGTFGDGAAKTGTITLTGVAP
jgi:hypothetical protein